ncbi:hypothetical protein ACTWQL_08540 [Pseudalkalibacillus sp. R45]|uniref:hypothetical protein n=1 Tax=Pseudalkalibacillus sp. R45 TaxID=3457433 RepID=UPI003FCE208F
MDKKVVVGLLSLILYVVFFLPLMHWDNKVQAVVTLVIIQMLWIGRVFPLAFSSICCVLSL